MIKRLFKRFLEIEFFRYAIVGAIATLVDWGIFYVFAIFFNVYYIISLIISYGCGTLTNYSLNKVFTFKCQSRQIAKQFSVHLTISIVSLLFNILLMYVFVDSMKFGKMESRVVTTLIMLLVNFFLHKKITFNKNIFK